MLCQKFANPEEINIKTNIQIFPDISDRDFWEKSKEYSACFFEETVKKYEGVERKHLTASLYRKFSIDGDRTEFEAVYFSRRSELVNKLILECFYNDGRYTDDIVDLTWLILEETTWSLPAHIKYSKSSDSLPTYEVDYIDLFAAETVCLVSFVYQVFGRKLDEVSAQITKRIKKRVKEHLKVYLENDMWWMGRPGYRPNNWNPWINSNILAGAFIMEEDEDVLRKLVYRAMWSLDHYFDNYPEDGACDEGASYWGHAGLSMLEDLWLLNLGTGGQIDFFESEKVNNTLEFFMKVYAGHGQVVNFADCSINVPIFYPTIYKMGKLTKNEKVISFAKFLCDTVNVKDHTGGDVVKRGMYISGKMTNVLRMMDIVTYSAEMENLEKSQFKPDSDYYLASTQVVTSRQGSDPRKGLFLAAKGGHNNEHHNHNDVGSFIVYKNGTKFLIDSGNMQYTSKTFGEYRYTLWTTRSVYHNVPVIDGVEQKDGEQFAAKNATCQMAENKIIFSLDIADAYPTDVINKWQRTIEYDKSCQTISVTEDFELSKECEYSLNFLSPQNAEMSGNSLKLTAENGETLQMQFDSELDLQIEKVDFENDGVILKNWGENLYLLKLKSKSKANIIKYIIK